jgi:hypothetical protein
MVSVDEAAAWITASKPCVAGVEEGLMRTFIGDETVVKPLRGVLTIPWPFFAEVLVHNGPDQRGRQQRAEAALCRDLHRLRSALNRDGDDVPYLTHTYISSSRSVTATATTNSPCNRDSFRNGV